MSVSRLVVAVARTAAGFGASVLTRVEALDIAGDGATLRDTATGETLHVRAGAVIGAAGVWAGQLDADVRVRPSRGPARPLTRPANRSNCIEWGANAHSIHMCPR